MGSRAVMIIEDDSDIRETLVEVLDEEGFVALQAANGREALDSLRQLEQESLPCLIFLDLVMPVMDGWAFLEAQRQDSLLAPVPVVVFSATGDVLRAEALQEVRVLRKPIALEDVLETVREVCGSQAPAA